ncbi:MAG: phospho-N-acetylmuramoyl-pentapeptide-transferase [Limisphaerales bacterium]
MFFDLSQYLRTRAEGTEWAEWLSALRVFEYITFRSAAAAITALLFSWWMGPSVIAWLKRLKFGQDYTDKAEEAGGLGARVLSKRGTPTMGGILIVVVMDLSGLLWAQWNELVVLTLLSLIVLAGLGFYDDYAKITRQNNLGTTSIIKLTVQTLLAGFIGIYLWFVPDTTQLISEIHVPFYKHPVATGSLFLGLLVTILAIVGSSNAVNLTDGLDGLAIGCTVIVTTVFIIFTYIAGNAVLARYLQVPFVAGAGELTVFCSAMFGASLGFLWFNCHPAQVFMGDTGSLALGGALGIMAVLINQPFILPIAGGVFVAEAASVMIQRSWFKITRRTTGVGQRVFLMAPLHHHFERKGWYESQVVTRFYILCILCAVVALATLKLR